VVAAEKGEAGKGGKNTIEKKKKRREKETESLAYLQSQFPNYQIAERPQGRKEKEGTKQKSRV